MSTRSLGNNKQGKKKATNNGHSGIYLEGGEHRDFPPLRWHDFPFLEFLKYTYRIVLKYRSKSDFPLLKNQQLINLDIGDQYRKGVY